MNLGMMKSLMAGLLVSGAICGSAFAAETLFSNYVYAVAPAGSNGALWAFSRDNSYSGITMLNFKISDKGIIALETTAMEKVSDTLTAVQNGFILNDDDLAERRRLPAVYTGEDLGLVLPMFAMDKNDRFLKPEGYFSILDLKRMNEKHLKISSTIEDEEKDPMRYTASGFAYDSTAKRLWIARGMLGVMVHDISSNKGSKDTSFILNFKKSNLEEFKNDAVPDSSSHLDVFDVHIHPETRDLWLATSQGIWIKSTNGLKKFSGKLDTSRVTGLWMGGKPLQVIAETNHKDKKNVVGGLWRLYDGKDKDFSEVNFLDTAGKVQKGIYDKADYTVSGIAFIGKTAYVLVRTIGGSISGYLKLDSLGIKAWEKDEDENNQWLYGYETGVTDRRAAIVSISAFPLSKSRMGLAVATEGNGISVSADSGATWSVFLNRAKLDNNLGSIRMVPSVITPGDESLVSYKVGRESKITIEVFSYDMHKVRTIVKDAVRNADASRSTNPKEDFWDGRDDHGKDCTMGVYYIRVKDNHGHIGWGKTMTLGGSFR